ncbi:putative leader peptide [Streptomyces sp. NPDC088719]|uniref:putative leader peptide n=1 Tax=Streptomyces sp. NPDC088719 TaxID=3365872 RepID=UPI00381AE864
MPGGSSRPGPGSTPTGPPGSIDRWAVARDRLTVTGARGVLQIMTDTDVRLWRRVHMDLVRYAGCVCRPSC